MTFCAWPGAANAAFTIDSLDGDITANEINQFISSINGLTPPVNNWGDNMSTHGTAVEGMRRMYEATGNIAILNRLIVFSDIALVHRNDEPLGEHRVMWDGTVAPGWPESSTNTTPACSSGQIHGNIAYCAKLILENPSIWNTTVPDGNPYGYGVTYKQRATNYLARIDAGLAAYTTKWFVNTNTFRIHTPTDSRWLPASGNDTAETAWNRQALFVMGYQYAARCHDLLGDNPSFLPLYKGVVNAFVTWFVTAYPNGGSQYYTSGGHNVAKWWYQIPTDQHIENIGHAQHDMIGLYQGWESGYTGLTSAQVKVYADTAQFVINLGSTGSWSLNVDGTGTPSTSLKTDFIFLSQWNPPLYKMIAQSNIDANQLNGSEGCKNTGYILWMKHWRLLNAPAGFSLSATPAGQTIFPGSNATFTVSLATNSALTGSVSFAVSGLPANTGATFSPPSLSANGNSTLSITSSPSAPLGSYPLTITGTNAAVGTNTIGVVLNIVTPSGLFWNGGSSVGGNWSDSANWNGQSLSPNATLTFNGLVRLDNTNDTTAGTTYSNILFNAGAGAFSLYGNPITLRGGVTNNSSVPQTINLGLIFTNSIAVNGAGSGLIIQGGLTNSVGASGPTTLTLGGIGSLKNLFNSTPSPGGTNIIALNNSAANWTLIDNDSSAPMTVPWVFAVNNGTFNFGDDVDAPTLTLTTPNNVPQDNQIGAVSGGTGVFNMMNGTLTTSARFNTATALNTTGIVNQVGGTMNIGSQFQGANGANAGEVSVVNISGGTMNVGSGGSGPFYVASRGTGTLNLSDDGLVSCGTLNVARNLTGTSVQQHGVVNLDGGTLAVNSVTKDATVAGNTAAFNFNGGILKAKQDNAAFISTANAPDLAATVKAGGAIIDSAAFNVTVPLPLLHDSGLGGIADGGLIKLGAGTLTLTATNAYNGDTLVNGGRLALSGSGSIGTGRTVTVTSGAVLDASQRTNGTLMIGTGQTLTGGGSVMGNVVVSSGGTLAPGGGLNTLTFSNNLTLNAGSTTVMEISNSAATNDSAQVTGNVVYGGTLVVTNVNVSPLGPDDSFKLFSAGGYSGSFAEIIPAIPGTNLAWNTDTLATDGTLRIASVTPSLQFVSMTADGTNWIFTGNNGVSNGLYYVLSTTNLSLPLTDWVEIATNTFDDNGAFIFTNPAAPGRQHYFSLKRQVTP